MCGVRTAPLSRCVGTTTLMELQHAAYHTLHNVRLCIARMMHVRTELHQLRARVTPALSAVMAQLRVACATGPATAAAEQLQRRRLILLRAVRRVLRPLKLARDELEGEVSALLASEAVCAGALPARVHEVLLRPLPSLQVETMTDVMAYLDERALESHDVDEAEELLRSMGGGQWWWGEGGGCDGTVKEGVQGR